MKTDKPKTEGRTWVIRMAGDVEPIVLNDGEPITGEDAIEGLILADMKRDVKDMGSVQEDVYFTVALRDGQYLEGDTLGGGFIDNLRHRARGGEAA